MKKFRYLAILATLICVASCVQTDVDESIEVNNGKTIQVVAHVASFSDCDVDSRALKVGDESSVKSLCFVVFNEQSICTRKEYQASTQPITLSTNDLGNGYTLCMFANIENPSLGQGNTMNEFFSHISCPVNSVDIPEFDGEKCIPMYGEKKISGALDAVIQIPLTAMYAKVVVNIISKPDQSVVGNTPAKFSLTRYEVHNVVESVDFVGGTISAKGQNGGTDDQTPVSTNVYTANNITSDVAQADKEASFFFYLPERFLKAGTAADAYEYPFGKASDGTIRPEDEKYRQRFKPCLVEGKGATFVRFFGEYIDHQGHNYNVSYDIYVGNDNYSNFDIEANTQYNNYVTIKGIATSSDATEETISVDYRVNIERVNPVIINLRRETLLDSHFEVRPLRIRKNPAYTGQEKNTSVEVEVIYKDQADAKWVGIERSFGNGEEKIDNTYLMKSELDKTNRTNAAGKRRYFTSDLTKSLQSPVTIPITDDGETVWIYVDEALSANAKDGVRSATIKVSYLVNDVPYGDPIYYTISQRELFPVTYGSNKYLIEYHEEYLHNYDADDSYGQTDYEGMQWGLDGEKISEINQNHKAYVTEPGGDDGITSAIYNSVVTKANAYYDFYMPRDIDKSKWYIEGDFTLHERAGHDFTNEIVQAQSIAQCNLAEVPTSAVQYCLSKNKKGENNWYLPAIDEIEDIVMSTYGKDQYSYSRFPDFRAKFYWSSQPAYTRNYFDGQRTLGDRWGIYQQDNLDYARATKVKYENTTGGGASDPDNYHNEGSGIPMGGHPWGSGNGTVTSNIYCHQYISGEISGTQWTGYTYNGTIDEVPDSGKTIEGSNSYGVTNIFGSHKWKHTLIRPEPYYEPGYKRRTDYARVRCVRKQ